MFRSTSGTRRVLLVLCALLLSLVFVLPKQSHTLLQAIGKPLADLVALPLELLSSTDRRAGAIWNRYVALWTVQEENEQLRREIEFLRGQTADLREMAAANRRLTELLRFQAHAPSVTVGARVIGRDATNWYRGVVLDKGEQDGVRTEMGVVTLAGAVGRVVKTRTSSSVVLLITDPNNAVTSLIQRTRDEGIIEGTFEGQVRMKYIPLLSTVRVGDPVVTSGLTGGFPKGVPVGTITSIHKDESGLFQTADVRPEVDFTKVEEVLVVTAPRSTEEPPPAPPAEKSKP
ncbi:MAG TPA: rod shape-determining protein MreC [Nitrospiraceae bacterium]